MPWSFEEPAKARLEVPGTAPSGGRFQSPEALEFALHSRLPLYNFRFCASGGCFPSKQVCAFEPSDPAGVRSRRGHRWEIDPQTKGGAGTGAGPGEVGWERGFPSERARPGSPLPRVRLLCRAPFLLDLSLEAAPAAVGECDPLRSD